MSKGHNSKKLPQQKHAPVQRPLSYDELLERDNLPATEPTPKAVAERFRTFRMPISIPGLAKAGGEPPARISPSGDHWEIELSENAIPGQLAKPAQWVKPASLARGSKASGPLGSFKPPWASTVYHPKMNPAHHASPLRNRRSRRIAPQMQGVFGRDDRVTFRPDGYPNHCVGKLFVGNSARGFNSSGTATLVGSRTIITAGHMVPWGAAVWQALFIPGFFDGTSVDGPGVRSFVTDAFGYNDPVSKYDVAVMRLAQPLGDSLGYFGALWYDDALDDHPLWTLIGYPGSVGGGNRPSIQSGIPVLDRDSDGAGAMELEHHGDSTPGDSGGPLWGWWPYSGGIGPFIAGVEAGYEEYEVLWWTTDEDNIAAGGNSMLDLIRWARTNWV